jgi:predicted dehydrogenase
MASSPVRIGVIGCGQISRAHLGTYQKLGPDLVQVVAVCDILEDVAHDAAKQFGVPDVYTAFRKMLERDDIQAIDVCLHNNLHRPATEAALAAGKHVYCEKPMAGSYADAVSMLQSAKKAGLKLHIQLATLYSKETRAAKELIAAGELGEVYHARATGHRRRGRPFVDGYGTNNFVQKRISAGGALYDMGVYHISQMLYLLGNPKVARISGKTYQKIDMDPARRQSSGYDVEELGLGMVYFENGATLDIIEAWAINLDKIEGSVLVGSKGGVRLNPFGFFRSFGDLDISGTADLDQAGFRWGNVRGDAHLYASSQAHWIAVLQGKVELLPTAEIALSTMLISEAIYMSEKLGRDVTADEVLKASKSTAVVI